MHDEYVLAHKTYPIDYYLFLFWQYLYVIVAILLLVVVGLIWLMWKLAGPRAVPPASDEGDPPTP